MNRMLTAATLVVVSAWAREGAAANGPERPFECRHPIDADAVVRCALDASAEVTEAREKLAAVAGRRATATGTFKR
jgi:hypothetical protein